MFRGSVKSTGYPLHSTVSPSLSLPCVTVCHHISTGVLSHQTLTGPLSLTPLFLCICNISRLFKRFPVFVVYVMSVSSRNIRLIRSGRVSWAGSFGTCGEPGEIHTGFWRGDLKEKVRLENLGVDVLKWFFNKLDREKWTGLIWLRIGTGGGNL